MILRRATSADTSFLRQLHHRVYRDVTTRQFGTWDDSVQDGFFEKSLAEAEFYIVEEDGELIGAIGLAESPECLHLVELQIVPEYQGRGFGTALLRMHIEQAQRRQQAIALQVLFENRAISLYARHGFVVTGQTDTHYVMERRPDAPPT